MKKIFIIVFAVLILISFWAYFRYYKSESPKVSPGVQESIVGPTTKPSVKGPTGAPFIKGPTTPPPY